MIDKQVPDLATAVAPITDGATVMVGGFGDAGIPFELLDALVAHGATDLTIISNNAGTFERGIAALILNKQVKKIICSHPRPPHSEVFAQAFKAGAIELELVPQGTLAERIRHAGSGLGPFYTPTGANTALEAGKESILYNGVKMIREDPLSADFALIRAHQGDRWGNLMYRGAARNFNPLMAMAARHTIAQVDEIVPLGTFDPLHVMTPGVFVTHLVTVGRTNHDK